VGGEIDDELANLVTAQLLFLEGQDAEREIWLHINSPGGLGDRLLLHLRRDEVRAGPGQHRLPRDGGERRDLDRDRYLTASEALDYGLIDRIVEHRPDQSG